MFFLLSNLKSSHDFRPLFAAPTSVPEASIFFLESVCLQVWTKSFSGITKLCISASSYSSSVCAGRPKPFWWLLWKCPPRSPDTLQNTQDTGLRSSAAGSLRPAITRRENQLVWLHLLIGQRTVLVPVCTFPLKITFSSMLIHSVIPACM